MKSIFQAAAANNRHSDARFLVKKFDLVVLAPFAQASGARK